jgi:hypothetical protein
MVASSGRFGFMLEVLAINAPRGRIGDRAAQAASMKLG